MRRIAFGQIKLFQLTAARRRLGLALRCRCIFGVISTHSRAKAAGLKGGHSMPFKIISTHSRAKAAGTVAAFKCHG